MRSSSVITGLFLSAEEARLAAQELGTRGFGPRRMETAVHSAAPAVRHAPRAGWVSLCVAGACGLVLALATLVVPGIGYALALIALMTVLRVRPAEVEHRLLIRDQVLSEGGAVLIVRPEVRKEAVVRLLQRYGAIDVEEIGDAAVSGKEIL